MCAFKQTPTLIVFGALDTNLGAQSHKNLIQLPHHSVLKIEGARHACYMEKTREFHKGLIEFLNTLKWGMGPRKSRREKIKENEKEDEQKWWELPWLLVYDLCLARRY